MRNLLLSFLLFGFTTCVWGQENMPNTYLDALKLAKIYAADDAGDYVPYELIEEYNKTVKKYIGDKYDFMNPFLKDIEPRLIYKPQAMVTEGNSVSSNGTSWVADMGKFGISNILSTSWQSAAINGMSNFMAGRFKAEVLHMGLEQVFSNIQQRDSIVAKTLFPKTFNQIEKMYSPDVPNSYYSADLLFLRQIVLTDLDNMPGNVIQSDLLLSKIKDSKRKDLLNVGYHVVNYSKQGFPLPKIIEKLNQYNYESSEIKEISKIIHLFSEALRDKEESQTKWVNPLTRLDFNPNKTKKNLEIRFFYGLLYEQIIETSLLKELPSGEKEISDKMQEILLFVNVLNNAYDSAKDKEFNFSKPEDYLSYTRNILSALKIVTNNDVVKKAYNLDDKQIDMTLKYINIIEPFMTKDYQRAVPILIAELGEYLSDDGGIKYLRSVNFLSQLASVENDGDMEKLLSAYSLPIGSSSIKRNSVWNVSLNGYVGLTGGKETAYRDSGNETKWNVGLTAPIGIAVTYHKITAFASIIDLGTMVNARLDNDMTSYSGLKFEHFLSPGLGLYYNLPKLPLTFGVHYNYIPHLRTVTLENEAATVLEEKNVSVARFNFSVLVDIPFFTIFNNSKR